MIDIKVKNLDKIKSELSKLPKEMQRVCYDEAALHLIGDDTHGLQYYPPYAGRTPQRRTYNLRFGWKTNFGLGTKMKITNAVEYAPYVYTRWSGSPWNWRTIKKIIKLETPGMMKAIYKQISRLITASGFGWSGKE